MGFLRCVWDILSAIYCIPYCLRAHELTYSINEKKATTFLSTIFHFQSTLTLQQNMHMRIPLNSPQCSSFALSKLEYVCTYVLQFQVCGMENCFSTPHLTFQARVDFQWCVELEMESLLSIPYFQCGIPGQCCISFHLYCIRGAICVYKP